MLQYKQFTVIKSESFNFIFHQIGKQFGVFMKKNVGGIDKIARMIIGLVIIAVGFYTNSWWGLVGIVPLFTSFLGWCPAYLPFGISTCKTDPKSK